MVQMGDRFAIDHDEMLSFIHGKQAITSFAILCRVAARRISRPKFRWLEQMKPRIRGHRRCRGRWPC
jgi:sugar-phosphatase